jgi:hypothetical protein
MSFRRFATGAALAIAGLAAAVGIGLLANSISGDNVGLGAEPLSAGETLAVHDKADDRAEKRKQRQRRRRNRNGDETRTAASPTLTDEIAPATPTDDNGGDDQGDEGNSGKGSSGSSGSNSGSGGSGGSGSSGSGSGGSDDSGGGDDD